MYDSSWNDNNTEREILVVNDLLNRNIKYNDGFEIRQNVTAITLDFLFKRQSMQKPPKS